jgi:hypothetical protein
MTRFFKTIYWSLVLLSYSPPMLLGQTDLPRQSVGLSPFDSIFVQNSLQLVPKDNYAYLVVHGSGKTFQCLEGTIWNRISNGDLANRIASNRAFDGKTIVLLSCSDTTATQNFANALASLDNSAIPKRPLRPIIGWDGEVAIYSNGFIEGTGRCRKFAPIPLTPSTVLVGANVPKGSGKTPTAGMASVLLMNQEGYDIGKLISDKTKASAIRLMWRSYKINFLANPNNSRFITDGEIKNPAIFKSWLYLRVTVGSDTKLTGDSEFMLALSDVLNKNFYIKNDSDTATIPSST